MSAADESRRLAAIMMADVVGFSRLMSRDESGTLQRLRALWREVVFPEIEAADGRVIKTTGDGLLAEFKSTVRAVECAVAIQETIAKRSAPETAPALLLRIGINLGDVVADADGDLYGDGVNVAARLEAAAPPGGLSISRAVHDIVRDKLPLVFEDRGEQTLKNIDRPIGIYQLVLPPLLREREDTPPELPRVETVFEASAPLHLRPGTVLNDLFVVEGFIGSGGLGDVYKARGLGTGEAVAVKTIKPEIARDPNVITLFRKEAAVLRNLSHPAVVRYSVFSAGTERTPPYLAMEFVDGVPLSDVIARAPLRLDEVDLLRRRLAGALKAVHAAGVIHRDLSPDNVVLPRGDVGSAKIIDFGIARSSFGGGTVIGQGFAGKYAYVSPEQLGLFGGEVTDRSDIYALGLVLAEAALGRRLFLGESHLALIEARRRPPDLSDVEARLAPLLSAMLAPDPADRMSSMAEVEVWSPNDEPSRRPVRRLLPIGAAIALCGAAAGAGAWWLQRGTSSEPIAISAASKDSTPRLETGVAKGAPFEEALANRIAALLPRLSRDRVADGARRYVEAKGHKAQAVSYDPFGMWRSTDRDNPEAAAEKALEGCQIQHGAPCALLAVDHRLEPLPRDGTDPRRRDMPRASFAGTFDPERIPAAWPIGQQPGNVAGYRAMPGPKAAAYHPWGRMFVASAPDQRAAEEAALAACRNDSIRKGADGPCYLYAVDDQVVLPRRRTEPVATAPRVPTSMSDALLAWLVAATPAVSAASRLERVQRYAEAPGSKSQALAPGTTFSWRVSGRATAAAAEEAALEACQVRAGQPCVTVAVNETVLPRPNDGAWRARDMSRARYGGPFDPGQVPTLSERGRSRPDVMGYASAPGSKAAALHPRGLLVDRRATLTP